MAENRPPSPNMPETASGLSSKLAGRASTPAFAQSTHWAASLPGNTSSDIDIHMRSRACAGSDRCWALCPRRSGVLLIAILLSVCADAPVFGLSARCAAPSNVTTSVRRPTFRLRDGACARAHCVRPEEPTARTTVAQGGLAYAAGGTRVAPPRGRPRLRVRAHAMSR